MRDSNALANEQIWDPAVRLFHWSLVLAVVGGWLLGHFGPLQMTLHFWAGYAVAALILFRLVWGFVGPRNARFAAFLRGPGAVMAYARSLPERAAGWRAERPETAWGLVRRRHAAGACRAGRHRPDPRPRGLCQARPACRCGPCRVEPLGAWHASPAWRGAAGAGGAACRRDPVLP